MRIALVQLNVGESPRQNLGTTLNLVRSAAASGAKLVTTPECTNLISSSARQLADIVQPQNDDLTLNALRNEAAKLGIHILIGSLCLANETAKPGVAVNRQVLVNPDGTIQSVYDKIHMFDVQVSDGQHYRESELYAPGDTPVLSHLDGHQVGHSICYDLRFPYLYAMLAQRGAKLIFAPAAFTYVTGKAHWSVLLRARAIETGSWIVAPAQCGTHPKRRRTWGHSMIVSPWGEILSQANGERPCVTLAEIDWHLATAARDSIPNLKHYRTLKL